MSGPQKSTKSNFIHCLQCYRPRSRKLDLPLSASWLAVQQTQISFIKAAPEIALYCHFREIFSTNIKISVLNQDEMGNLGWQKKTRLLPFHIFSTLLSLQL